MELSSTAGDDEQSSTKRLCDMCGNIRSKYTCPCCSLKTCSLSCVKKHKVDFDCTGLRDKTAYKAVNDFNDLGLLSDYRFMEDAGRITANAVRDDQNKFQPKRPRALQLLLKEARKRKVHLHILPQALSKRRKNCTRYYYKDKSIRWYVEVIIPEADVVCFSNFEERIPVKDVVKHVLHLPEYKTKLKSLSNTDDLKVFMKKEHCPANDKRFFDLNLEQPIAANLENKDVVEYPTFYLVSKENWKSYPLTDHGDSATVEASCTSNTEGEAKDNLTCQS